LLDEPGKRYAGEVRGDKRKDAEDEKTAIPVDEELNAVVMAQNLGFLLPGRWR
jgi:hypothetical protein